MSGRAMVTLVGLNLERVRSACWISASRSDTIRSIIAAVAQDRVFLRFSRRLGDEPGATILASDDLGRGAAFPASMLSVEDLESEPEHNPIVRFHPNTVDLPAGSWAAQIEDVITYREGVKETLANAGVDSLRRLLPVSHPTSQLTANLLDEPILADDLADIYVAVLDSSAASSAVSTLAAMPWVQYAEPTDHKATFFTNDPYWPQQWNLHNEVADVCGYPSQPGLDLGVLTAWSLTQGSLATRIGVLDSGVLATHPDLPSHLVVGRFFTPYPPFESEHGTAVIGIISAVPDNGEGLAGIAPGVTPVSMKLDLSSDTIAVAIQHCATQGYPIVNMSFGGPGLTAAVRDACRLAFETGLLLVAATGNSDDAIPNYPAAYQRFVTAVTATLPDGRPWRDFFITGEPGGEGNSIGPHVDLCSPAGNYAVTTGATPVGAYYWNLDNCSPGEPAGFGHTSAAAPMVSAVAGLLHSYGTSVLNYRLLGEDMAEILERTAEDIELSPAQPGKDDYAGWGMVRANQALAFIAPPRRLAHGDVGYLAGDGNLAVTDSTQNQTREFRGVAGLPDGVYTNVTVVHLQGLATFGPSFIAAPAIWVRSSGTLGWSDVGLVDRNLDGMDGVVVAGSLNQDQAQLRTTLYRVPGFGWFPVEPAKARIAYTVVGDVSDLVAVDGVAPNDAVELEIAANPGRGRMLFGIVLPRPSTVRLIAYDVSGREVRRLVDGLLPSGRHQVAWEGFGSDGQRASSGVYFCRLEACGEVVDRRVVYLRK